MQLIPLLTKNLGVSEPQAKGGAGAIFDYVKQKVSAEDFAKVTSALPGIDSLLEYAPKTSDLLQQIGGLSPALGGKANLAGGMAGLTESLAKLGLDAGMVDKYVKTILDFSQSEAGKAVTNTSRVFWSREFILRLPRLFKEHGGKVKQSLLGGL